LYSYAQIDTVIDTPVTQHVDTYTTELIARLQGGPVLFDQTLGAPYAAPSFQALIGSAQTVLSANGATTFLGPYLSSSGNTLTSSTQTVQTGQSTTSVYTNVETFDGPLTIQYGDFGVCQNYSLDAHGHPLPTGCTSAGQTLSIPAGIYIWSDTFILSFVNVDTTTTTTNTDLLTQVYELDGLTAQDAVPEPSTWVLIVVGFGGLGFATYRKRRPAISSA
jgi:PEP-CTERM motif